MRWSEVTPAVTKCILPVIALCLATVAWAQQPEPAAQSPDLATSLHDLQQQIQELRTAVTELRAEAAQYHAETVQLRQELQAAHGQNSVQLQVTQPNQSATPDADNQYPAVQNNSVSPVSEPSTSASSNSNRL